MIVNWVPDKEFDNLNYGSLGWNGTVKEGIKNSHFVEIRYYIVHGSLRILIARANTHPNIGVRRGFRWRPRTRRDKDIVGKTQIIVTITSDKTPVLPIGAARQLSVVIEEGMAMYIRHSKVSEVENFVWE